MQSTCFTKLSVIDNSRSAIDEFSWGYETFLVKVPGLKFDKFLIFEKKTVNFINETARFFNYHTIEGATEKFFKFQTLVL